MYTHTRKLKDNDGQGTTGMEEKKTILQGRTSTIMMSNFVRFKLVIYNHTVLPSFLILLKKVVLQD